MHQVLYFLLTLDFEHFQSKDIRPPPKYQGYGKTDERA